MTAPAYSPGLEGVIAGETAISSVWDGLRYRGYPVAELAEHATFDEVAYLLLYGELPAAAELKAFQARVAMARRLPEPVRQLFHALPKWTPPLDALRTAVSALAHFDQDMADNSHEANVRKAERLLAQMPVAVADQYRISQGLQPVLARQELSHAANFLYMLRGTEPTPEEVRALDVSLILYAEHEFNASTFTARVIASTLSDLHSAITGAIGALKGSLHGGANEKVMDVLRAAGGPEAAGAWTLDALGRKERIMGFGHRVYKVEDPRARQLRRMSKQIGEQAGDTRWYDISEKVREVVKREKGLEVNVDFYSASTYYSMGIQPDLYTPIFAVSRIVGWTAHVMEQYAHNRLIRPRAEYIGPTDKHYVPIEKRG
jgi:citrate synthase